MHEDSPVPFIAPLDRENRHQNGANKKNKKDQALARKTSLTRE